MKTLFSLTNGNAILVAFGITTFLFISTMGAGVLINNSIKEAGRIENSRKAFYSAEGGIEEALYAAAHHASGWLRTSDPDFHDLAFPNNTVSSWSANGRKGIQSGKKVWDRLGDNPIVFFPAQEDTSNDFDLGNWREVEMGKEISFDLFVDESDYKKDSSYGKAAFLPKNPQRNSLFPSAFAGSTPEGNIIGEITREKGGIIEFSLDIGVGGGIYEINWGDGSPREPFAVSGNYSHVYQNEGEFFVSVEGTGGISFPIETVYIVQDILPFEEEVDNLTAVIATSISSTNLFISGEITVVIPPFPVGITDAEINWGDGNKNLLSSSGGPVHHVYSDLGQKQISLVVEKPGGGQYSSRILDVIIENPSDLPFDVAFVSGTQAVFSLETNEIGVSSMTVIPPVDSFKINWGDQEQVIVDNIVLTHIYDSEGTYPVWVLKNGSPYYFVGIAEQYHKTGQEFGDQISEVMLNHVSLPNDSPFLSHQSEARVVFASGFSLPNGVGIDDMRIMWGDGISTIISSGNTIDHLYDSTGTYSIQIAFTLLYDGKSFPFSLDVGSMTVQKTPICTTSGNATGNNIFQTKRAENMTDFTTFMTKGLEGECPTVFFGGAASVTENANINILPSLSASSLPVTEWRLEGSPPVWILDLFESTGGSISGQVPDGALEGPSPLFFVAEVDIGGEIGSLISPPFLLDITRVNDVPTMDYAGTFVLSKYVNESFSISGIAFDEYFSDADTDTLTYSFRQDNVSAWDQLNIDFISGELQAKINTTGTHIFWIKVTDPDGEESPELEIHIITEDRPVLTPRGVKHAFQVDASDVKTLFSDHGANSPIKEVFFDLFLPYDSLPSDLNPEQILLSWSLEAATDLGSMSAYSVAQCLEGDPPFATTNDDGVICISHFRSGGFNSGDIYEKHESPGEGIFIRIKNPIGVFVLENGERKIESLLHILQRENSTGDIFPEPLFPRLTVQIGREQSWDDGFGNITYLKKAYVRMGIEIDPSVVVGMNLQDIPLPDENISIESIGSAGGFEQRLRVEIGPRRIAPMFEHAVFQQ